MIEAFNAAHVSAVKDAISRINDSNLPPESGWWEMRNALLNDDGGSPNRELLLELVRGSGSRLGNYLAMSVYRDFLAEEVRKRNPKREVTTSFRPSRNAQKLA
ncbi:hypothetical protein HJB90_29785 [Rhizobium sp. NLR10a]|uniref:hypothetical protein n=1 Tax=unclassified Rhizobium TaxID=2613769 RepID=UPI001C82E0E4|nr:MULTISPECIES: hypothetical protein [unclassified Rhizobium]MBX5279112.1 hypothetical protein [Rhizobium sp. NLR13a]MBX5285162.1 hypothetical protein [Rhizobium sp. NLR10a]